MNFFNKTKQALMRFTRKKRQEEPVVEPIVETVANPIVETVADPIVEPKHLLLAKKNRTILAKINSALTQFDFLRDDIADKTKIVPLNLQLKFSEQVYLLAELLVDPRNFPLTQDTLDYASEIADVMLQHFPADINARLLVLFDQKFERLNKNKIEVYKIKPKAKLKWILQYLNAVPKRPPQKWHVFLKNDGKVLGGEYDAQYNVPANYIV
jgi:hypothetical protein